MELNKIYHGNNLDILKTFDDNSIDSIVTDPPYGLGKEPNALEVLQSWITTGYHEIKGKGFMGKEWDSFVPQPVFWKECLRVLKPGGHLLSFAGTRTYDWVVIGLRIAGFEIRDLIAWVYGSGFPKSLDIGKQIDKRNGKDISWFGTWLRNWREENNIKQNEVSKLFPSKTGNKTGCVANWELGLNLPTAEQFTKIVEEFNLPFESLEEAEREIIGNVIRTKGIGIHDAGRNIDRSQYEHDITAPSTDEAKQWNGWGTALKPALEPIVMARKPLDGTVAQNVLKHGVGGINIDGCRVETSESDKYDIRHYTNEDCFINNKPKVSEFQVKPKNDLGRFPANFIHDGSDEVVKLFPNSDGAGGSTPQSKITGYGKNISNGSYEYYGGDRNTFDSGSGSASRFFYTAKASQTERNWGLNGFEEKFTASAEFRPNHMEKAIEGESGNPYGRWQPKKNIHPTVKPIDLMRYLVRLVTPKNGICLDPYMGSGTTAVACKAEKINYVGCELDEEYIKISEARIKAETVVYDIFDFGA
jgi:DNA modification methylase